MFDALKQLQSVGTAHSEFWKLVAYATSTVVLVKQGWTAQANWPFVALFISYLAIVAASSTAIKLFAMLGHRP